MFCIPSFLAIQIPLMFTMQQFQILEICTLFQQTKLQIFILTINVILHASTGKFIVKKREGIIVSSTLFSTYLEFLVYYNNIIIFSIFYLYFLQELEETVKEKDYIIKVWFLFINTALIDKSSKFVFTYNPIQIISRIKGNI